MSLPLRLGALLQGLVLTCFCGNLAATWSIVIIDTRTGEVAVGSATCIAGADLSALTAVIVVGKGGACAQSFVDTTGNNRLRIWNGFRSGLAPAQILAELARNDPGHQTRQYGIVDTTGRAVAFSGTQASNWKGHVTGRIGTLVYAIQGNLLAGAPVVANAETAVRNTRGDLADKLMAGMEAARAAGGDARCNPSKSAHIGFMIIAREGDANGVCNGNTGCATGSYYMNLNVRGVGSSPDPVFTLWNDFFKWRKRIFGRPDHYKSTVTLQTDSLPNDGKTKTRATVALQDYTGGGVLQAASTTVAVTLDPASTAPVRLGPVSRNPDGTYSFDITSGTQVGIAQLRIEADDGIGRPIRLAPRTPIAITPARLWISQPRVPITTGGNVELVVHQGSANANRPYVLLASMTGTTPGFAYGGLTIPLNTGPLFDFVVRNLTALPGFVGTVDATGRRAVNLNVPAGAYTLPINTQLHFATLLMAPPSDVSAPVGLQLVK